MSALLSFFLRGLNFIDLVHRGGGGILNGMAHNHKVNVPLTIKAQSVSIYSVNIVIPKIISIQLTLC